MNWSFLWTDHCGGNRRWTEPFTVCYGLTARSDWVKTKQDTKAAVTVQKSAHWILLYGLRRAEQEPPLCWTHQRDFCSPLLPGSPSARPPGQSGPDKRSAFTESTTWTLLSEAEVTQTTGGLISHQPDMINRSPLILLAPGRPLCPSLMFPVGFLSSHQSQSPSPPTFFFWPVVSGAVPVAATSLWMRRASLLILCHIDVLMSWDSNIFARVFFTLRAVRRDAGLWAQHSDISFPICRRH